MSSLRKSIVIGVFLATSVTVCASVANANGPAGGSTVSIRSMAGNLAVGTAHACAIVEGSVYCWGDNAEGQLGTLDSSVAASNIPIKVAGISTAVAVTAGYAHTCALLANETVSCWGSNQSKNLGRATGTNGEPAVVSGLSGVKAISSWNATTCAIVGSSRGLKCWGANMGATGSMLGRTTSNGSSDADATPGDVTGLTSGVQAVSVGQGSACALMTDKTLKCWGSNWEGRLGDDTTTATTDTSGPVSVYGLTDVAAVSVGSSHACAVVSSGKVYCWGSWESGQLGIDLGINDIAEITSRGSGHRPLETLDARASSNYLLNAQAISAGSAFSCAVRTTGVISCWGMNSSGEMGTGGKSQYLLAPVSVSGITDAAVVAAGTSFACAMSTTSVVKCWGGGGFATNAGQIGNGSNAEALTPATVTGVVAQTITFASLADKAAGDAAFTVSATATSGGPVSFASTTTSVCTVSGTTVTLVTPGTCTISASRAAYGLYKAADSVSRSFTIAGSKPTATTVDATAVGPTTATVNGSVNPGGASTTVTFEYSEKADLTGATSATVDAIDGLEAKSVSKSLTDLKPDAKYYFRVKATNDRGSSTGDIKSFTTGGAKPVVTTGSVVALATKATLNGTVDPKGLSTTVSFAYGTDPKLVGATMATAAAQTGEGQKDVSVTISNLAEKTTYYYRIEATNSIGSSQGDIKSFSTTRPEGVSINDGDEFTDSQSVTVSVVGTSTSVKAILSNDGGFTASETFDLVNGVANIPWKLQSTKQGTFTKLVYVKFVSRFGTQSTPYIDDIILDTTKPALSTVGAAAATPTGSSVTVSRVGIAAKTSAGGVKLSVNGSDTISGIGSIEVRSAASKPAVSVNVSNVAGKADGKPRRMSQSVSLKTSARQLQVRVLDRAGNASAWKTVTVK